MIRVNLPALRNMCVFARKLFKNTRDHLSKTHTAARSTKIQYFGKKINRGKTAQKRIKMHLNYTENRRQ